MTTKTPQAAQGLAEHVNEALSKAAEKGRLVPPWQCNERLAIMTRTSGMETFAIARGRGLPPFADAMRTEDDRLRAAGHVLTEDVVREAVASWIGWSDLASASRSVHPRTAPTSHPAVVTYAEYAESLVLLALAMQRPHVSVYKAFALAIDDQPRDTPSGLLLAAVEATEAVADVTGLSAREALPTLERAVTDIRLRLQRKSALGLDA